MSSCSVRQQHELGRDGTNEQFDQQVRMIEGSDLHLRFHLVDPSEPGKDLAYG